MPNVIDAPNPVAFLDDVAAGLPVVPGRSVEVGRRGALVRILSDGTGFVARADFAAAFPELPPSERAFMEDVFEEAVEAALFDAGTAEPPALGAALARALADLPAFGLGHHAGRLDEALRSAEDLC